MRAIFNFTPKHDSDFREITRGLRDQEDFRRFILENLGKGLTVTIENTKDKSEHSRLSTFFNGVITPYYVKILFNNGENVNKVDARNRLKKMFLRDIRTGEDGQDEVYTKSQKDLSTPELLFFVNQVLMHLLEDYNEEIPDKDKYLDAQVEGESIMYKIK